MIVSVLVLMALLVGPAFGQVEKPKADREIFTMDKKCQCDAIYSKDSWSMKVPSGTYIIIAKLDVVVCNGIGNYTCKLFAGSNMDLVNGSATYSPVAHWPGSCQTFYPATLTLVHTVPKGGGEVRFDITYSMTNPHTGESVQADVENLQITAMRVKDATEVDH